MRFADHIFGKCASGQPYWASAKRNNAASQSFLADEIAVTKALFTNAMRGYDSRQLVRLPAFSATMRKILAMEKRIDALASEVKEAKAKASTG